MAPKPSTSAKGKGKATAESFDPSALTVADTAQTAGQASRQLAHIYRLAFRYPEVVTPYRLVVDGKVVSADPTLLLQWKLHKAVPFWHEQCPPDFEAEWGARWSSIHNALKAMSELGTITAVNKFQWKHHGLDDVALQARNGKWYACMNDEIERVLEAEGKGIQAIYCTPYVYQQVVKKDLKGEQVVKGFVSPSHWDAYTSVIIPKVLGLGMELVQPDVVEWWHAMLGGILDARAKQRTRIDKRRDKYLNAAKATLGAELWQFKLPNGLTIKDATSALRNLREVKSCLDWLNTSALDATIRKEVIDVEAPDAASKIQSRWSRLSENAQKQDWVQMMLGFLMGLLSRRMEKEIDVDFGEEGQVYEYGVCLAKAVPLY